MNMDYISDLHYKVEGKWYAIVSSILYKRIFYKFGSKSRIVNPLRLKGVKSIEIGNNVTIDHHVHIVVLPSERSGASLVIHDGCHIGHYNHISAIDEVVIEKDVLTADRVYISDNYHAYEDISIPIIQGSIKSKGKTVIGEGTWIGDGVAIISSSIGKHCVIGANSVVTHDIPDYCVAVGAPAKVIKRYDKKNEEWIRV